MKILKNFVLVFLLTIPLFISAQDTRQLDHFDEIIVSGTVNLTLTEGDEEKMEITSSNGNYSNVKVHVNEGILKINLLKNLIRDHDDIKIKVTYKKIRRIKAYAGAIVDAKNEIKVDRLVLKLNSGAIMDLEINTGDLDAVVSEGSELTIEGNTESMEVRASSGGILDAFSLESNHTFVTSNTGGKAEVVARKSIQATANTGGIVEYKGKPEQSKIKDFLTGQVVRI